MESDRLNQAEKINEVGSDVSSEEKNKHLAEIHTDKVAFTHNASGKNDSVTEPAVFELQNLSVNFGRPILDQLTANVRGNCIGLLGPNGAGKTTLLNTLLGFNRPSSGRASIFGYDVSSQSDSVRHMVGYMPERDAFITGMVGIRFVRLMGELSGLSSSDALERAHEVFFYVGLGEARYRKIDTYSLGMKQLVKLAQAIVHGPKLLFLDEPTASLDPDVGDFVREYIEKYKKNNDLTILLASHNMKEVERLCNKVVMMKKGEVVDSGTCDELIKKHGRQNLEDTFLKIARSDNELK